MSNTNLGTIQISCSSFWLFNQPSFWTDLWDGGEMTILMSKFNIFLSNICALPERVRRGHDKKVWCICSHVCSWAACDHKQLIWGHVSLSPRGTTPAPVVDRTLWCVNHLPGWATVDSQLWRASSWNSSCPKALEREQNNFWRKWTPFLCQLWGCYSWKWAPLPISKSIQVSAGSWGLDLPQLNGQLPEPLQQCYSRGSET